MDHCRKTGSPTFTEPTIVPDIFTSGAAHVLAVNGGAVRLTFYIDVDVGHVADEVEHRIVDRVILARESIPALIAMLNEVLLAHSYASRMETPRVLAKAGH
jgi:hypothetical protein